LVFQQPGTQLPYITQRSQALAADWPVKKFCSGSIHPVQQRPVGRHNSDPVTGSAKKLGGFNGNHF
jgi:hypothetical protein